MANSHIRRAEAITVLAVGVCALVGGMMLGSALPVPTIESRIFRREGKPSVLRVYKRGFDTLMVEGRDGKYVPVNSYLSGISNESDREVEMAEILKAAEWYK